MSTAMDIDEFLEAAAQEAEAEKKSKTQDAAPTSEAGSASKDRDRDRRDRERDRDYGRDRGGRGRDRDQMRDRRDRGYMRESNNDRDRSYDRDRRRRDGSRPLSSYKEANTDKEDDGHRRRDDRDRDRSRDRRGGRDYRDRERERRNGGGDFYSGSGRARSRSPRRRDRDDGRDRFRSDRDRDRSRDRRRRSDDRRGPRRTPTPTEPEPTEDDRDKRTIFVQQISQRAETRHLRQFFEAIGPVVEAQIVKDRVTGRSKGVGYVEFKDEESVPKAIELTGQRLKGVPIIAQHTEAEKNRASRAAAADANTSGSNNQAPFHRLYVGNIHFSVTEQDLEAVFGPYGELEHVQLQRDEAPGGTGLGRSRGYGFVQYRDPAAAKSALETMNGFELANRQIRVGLGNDKFTPESTAQLLRNFSQQAQSYQGSAFSGAGGRGAYAGGSGSVFDRTHGRDDRGVTGASALDDTDVAGININNTNREKLMNMLARNPVEEPAKGSRNGAAAPKSRATAIDQPMASRCIKIQNAFDSEKEYSNFGDNWVSDLQVEVRTECNSKYGPVVHLAVDPNSDGDIYVKFSEVAGATNAMQGLNGRTFNYKVLRADYVVDKIYNSLYASAANL